MQEQISCPYPGLRPFNEDESIFFKGREEHIEQIVRQLEEKKFLMLTGASGDGKSSLVYAGVIPNAKAGFFKAKFNNWIVADFRPEREPLKNMAISIAKQLKIDDIARVQKELSYGFSSLIDIYKSSPYWLDQQGESFTSLDPTEQKKVKRKAANLLILVDQFEEFFTNPENFHENKASIESQAVINSLLETTRLAIEQDVPIYIVCTMRSDYIGQCASFRGLPEYIGYSQFFVPRLKRQEIYQVIEEPALLNGNKISKRLVEMLINEMTEGIDQLPVLQHALNQIWQQADKGQVEMDLIHFAKINGLPKNQLSEDDKLIFETWFDTLPEFKKELFKHSSLGDVLDAHANELFETSNQLSEAISEEDAKLIVETTFKCLTKIDESRAVRNRMTLQEVTRIINQPHVTNSLVSKVLHVFRLQGCTFLKPFIFEDDEIYKELSSDTVLDITHESLIRNWKKLSEWAKEEYENLLTWQDFKKQLDRWTSNNKSSGFLLPIGSLTFFENWIETSKPNKYWLARYDERAISAEEKEIHAEKILHDAKQFIRNSARRLFFNRTVIKYGADKIVAVLGLLLLVIGCTYFYFDFKSKQNEYVIEDLMSKSEELLKSKYIKNRVKADYIITAERLKPGSYKSLLKIIDSDSSRINTIREMFTSTIEVNSEKKDKDQDLKLIGELYEDQIVYSKSKNIFKNTKSFTENVSEVLGPIYGQIILKRINYPLIDHSVYNDFNQNTFASFKKLLKEKKTLKNIDIEVFNKLIQIIPNTVNYDSIKLKEISDLLNPFNAESKKTFDIIYPKDKSVKQDYSATINHNGGYYHLANLFLLSGQFNHFNRCYDSLLIQNPNFSSATYGYHSDRFIFDLIITNKLFTEEGKKISQKINNLKNVTYSFPQELILINRLTRSKSDISAYFVNQISTKLKNESNGFQTQLDQISYKQLENFIEAFAKEFIKSKKLNDNEKNYLLALLYKNKAFLNNTKNNYSKEKIYINLEKSISYFNLVNKDFLSEDVNIGALSVGNKVSRLKLFKFPFQVAIDDRWSAFRMEWNAMYYKDIGVFIDFLTANKKFNDFYLSNEQDSEILNDFLIKYYSLFKFNDFDINILDFNPLIANDRRFNDKIDKDAFYSFLTCYFYYRKDRARAQKYSNLININELLNKEKIKQNDNNFIYVEIAKNLINYYLTNDQESDKKIVKQNFGKAYSLLNTFQDEYQKRNALLKSISYLQENNQDAKAIVLLDTLLNTQITKSSKFGNKLFYILGQLSTNSGDKIAMNLMKDKSDKIKPNCLNLFIKGKSKKGLYYQATTFIPDYLSSSSQLSLYITILKADLEINPPKNEGTWYVMRKILMEYDENMWNGGSFEVDDDGFVYSSSDE